MAGGKKTCVDNKTKAKQTLHFEDEGHGNGKQKNEENGKRIKLSTPRGKTTKTSPRKLNIGKQTQKESNKDTVTVVFQEDNDEVTVEVDEIEQEFPMEDVDHDQSNSSQRNNNAMLDQNQSLENRKRKSPSRVDRFRKKVARASALFNQDSFEDQLDRELLSSSCEEGETKSEDEAETEDNDHGSDTLSVKIRPRTVEEIEKETDKTDGNNRMNKSSGKILMKSNKGESLRPMTKEKNKLVKGVDNRSSSSATTIYDLAIATQDDTTEGDNGKKQDKESNINRFSTSSEEINTSDEMIEFNNFNGLSLIPDRETTTKSDRFYEQEPRAGSSRQQYDQIGQGENHREESHYENEACERASQFVRDVENSRARLLDPKGKYNPVVIQENIHRESRRSHSQDDGYESDDEAYGGKNFLRHNPVEVDQDFLVVGNHVDKQIRNRIENGEFMDFSRLLPRDRLVVEEDNRLEIVNRNGRTYFIPAVDNDSIGAITNFSRWEQAFRVFSNIYTRRYPERASELIQYNHIIHTAALSYTWENVYLHDRDFRLHLSRFPNRSWAVILQQSWTMRLKDRNRHDESQGRS